jgi:hypothetical protein
MVSKNMGLIVSTPSGQKLASRDYRPAAGSPGGLIYAENLD